MGRPFFRASVTFRAPTTFRAHTSPAICETAGLNAFPSQPDLLPARTTGHIAGVDIGGANIKWYVPGDPGAATADTSRPAHPSAVARETSFAMWRHPQKLADRLTEDWRAVGRGGVDSLAVTMTGELADCFAGRREGVHHIIEQSMQAASRCGIRSVGFYSTSGRLLTARQGRADVDGVAAANWHALANAVAERVAPDGVLIDIGSTTSDVVAIARGQVLTTAKTDHQRLADRSLVYLGCRRTPVCSLIDEANWRGGTVPLMREVFATIDDARLVSGRQVAVFDDCETADGRPRDLPSASRRLARMLGLGVDEWTSAELRDFAEQVVASAGRCLRIALDAAQRRLDDRGVIDPPTILSGHGQDLLEAGGIDLGSRVIDLRDVLGREISRCAPAWAVVEVAESTRFFANLSTRPTGQ